MSECPVTPRCTNPWISGEIHVCSIDPAARERDEIALRFAVASFSTEADAECRLEDVASLGYSMADAFLAERARHRAGEVK